MGLEVCGTITSCDYQSGAISMHNRDGVNGTNVTLVQRGGVRWVW